MLLVRCLCVRFFYRDLVKYMCFGIIYLVLVRVSVNLFCFAVKYRSTVLSVSLVLETEIWKQVVSVPARSLFV